MLYTHASTGRLIVASASGELLDQPLPTPSLAVPLALTNLGDASVSQPVVTTGHAFGPGDVVGRVSLKDSTGNAVAVQQDQESFWPDGSLRMCVLRFQMTETLTAGQSVNYTVGADAAWPQRALASGWGNNPEATLMANSDIKVQFTGFDCGANTYTVSVNDILANSRLWPWGINHPVGGWEIIGSGPLARSWRMWRYLKNDQTGAPHAWIKLVIYLTAWSPTGPFEVMTLLTSPNTFGPIPGGDHAGDPPGRFAAVGTITNNGSFVAALGGAQSPDVMTIPSSALNPTNNQITLPGGTDLQQQSLVPPLVDRAFTLTSDGTLPSGLQPDTLYWLCPNPPYPGGGVWTTYFATNRAFVAVMDFNAAAWQPNQAYSIDRFVSANSSYYVCIKAGTSASSGSGPSGSGSVIDDGSCQWACAIVPLIDAGSGTMTATPVTFCFPNAGQVGADSDGQPFWIGTGNRPLIAPGHDFTYLTQKTKFVPPFSAAATAMTTNLERPTYRPGGAPNVPYYLATTGDNPGDERIGYVNNDAAASLYLPADPYYYFKPLFQSLQWADYPVILEDEAVGKPAICNNGPDKAGSSYPNMPPPHSDWILRNGPSNVGQPGGWVRWSSAIKDQGGWMNYSVVNYGNSSVDPSHLPAFWQIPYLRTGHRVHLDLGIMLGRAVSYDTSYPWMDLDGVRYYGVIPSTDENTFVSNSGQIRGWGWALRALSQAHYAVPASDPIMPFLRDTYNDNGDWLAGFYPAKIATPGQTFGLFPCMLTDHRSQYMTNYFRLAIAQEAWRNLRPGFLIMSRYLANNDQAFDVNFDSTSCLSWGGAYDLVWGPATADWTPTDFLNAYQKPGDCFNATATWRSIPAYATCPGVGLDDGFGGIQPWGPRPNGLPYQCNSYNSGWRAAMTTALLADPTLASTTRVLERVNATIEAEGGAVWTWRQAAGQWQLPDSTSGTIYNFHCMAIY